MVEVVPRWYLLKGYPLENFSLTIFFIVIFIDACIDSQPFKSITCRQGNRYFSFQFKQGRKNKAIFSASSLPCGCSSSFRTKCLICIGGHLLTVFLLSTICAPNGPINIDFNEDSLFLWQISPNILAQFGG